ncbi:MULTISPECIES: DUF2533 family protein [unclassified Bacillus (in: firmicutes)]|uniref:DUF2533 family protein n=1 Tax=unclassified Bacillus (in: firmicutes) TaxID=185979 RepID=UPI0008DFD93A|nr:MULTISPECIES: DUF2533 family protein [unclassified Bacillus (in: firmicutes)]SFA69505.1 Protein of unknown function [Bacillus sp. UNCCL13]SFQ58819.1 Protein of unknown function [Bacillus sp. cl95]
MSVHKAISQHVGGQNRTITEFLQLDQYRETLIEEALELCKQNKPFKTDRINEVTKEMNALNMKGELPKRKLVSVEMIMDYVNSHRNG